MTNNPDNKLFQSLEERSSRKCELCAGRSELSVFDVSLNGDAAPESSVLVCSTCRSQIEEPESRDSKHWRCLSNSAWSEVAGVQVLSWHMLSQLKNEQLKSEGWALELLEQVYLEDETLDWAKAYHLAKAGVQNGVATFDAHGTKLEAGDSVTLIKDLDVKGANFTAKRGTMVKNISLTEDPNNIEGKVNGTQIVLKTQFLKKST